MNAEEKRWKSHYSQDWGRAPREGTEPRQLRPGMRPDFVKEDAAIAHLMVRFAEVPGRQNCFGSWSLVIELLHHRTYWKKNTGRVPRKAAHDKGLYQRIHWKVTIHSGRGRCHLSISRIYWDCHVLSSWVYLVELILMRPACREVALWGPQGKLPKVAAVWLNITFWE